MTTSFSFAKGVLAATAGLLVLGAAATASAQSYDPCQREANNRSLKGGFLGAAGGAVLGSQFAANGHRRDGSLLSA